MLGRVAVLLSIFVGLLGVATAADKKSCESYFVRNRGPADPGCADICRSECTDGTCDQHGACNCSRGYENTRNFYYRCARVCPPTDHPENTAYCRKKCRAGCKFGVCDSFGLCKCNAGFSNNQNNHYLCESTCQPECRYGYCATTLRCVCRPGYRIIEPFGNCGKPCNSSDACGNGDCGSNGTCNCHAGYVNDGTNACVPIPAGPSCSAGQVVNGTCAEPCSSDRNCSSERPSCSPNGLCTVDATSTGCADRCSAECESSCEGRQCTSPEGSGTVNVESCTAACVSEKCDGDASKYELDGSYLMLVIGMAVTALVLLLATLLAVVLVKRRRRGEDASGDRMPMTDLPRYKRDEPESAAGNSNSETWPPSAGHDNFLETPEDVPWSGQAEGFTESDANTMPSRAEDEPYYASPKSSESTAKRSPRIHGQGDLERVSYVNMNNLSAEAEDDPVYLNVASKR